MRRKTLFFVIIGAAIIVGLAFAGQRYVIGGPAEPNPAAPAQPAAKAQPVQPEKTAATTETDAAQPAAPLLAVIEPGSLERFEDGQWVPVARGAALSTADRIRTKNRGVATVETGDGSRIELVDEVEVSVEALTRSLAELELHRGRLRADLNKGSGLALRVRSSGATAEAQDGAFVVYADGSGMVAVASETAQVKLAARDREVLLAGGQQSVVQPDQPPSDPEEIPDEVFLQVAWPQRRTQREKRLVLRGRVNPGTVVLVGEQPTAVGPDGSFEARVQLDAGPNQVVINATDPAGRTRSEQSPTVNVRNRPPRLEVMSQGQWTGQ